MQTFHSEKSKAEEEEGEDEDDSDSPATMREPYARKGRTSDSSSSDGTPIDNDVLKSKLNEDAYYFYQGTRYLHNILLFACLFFIFNVVH